MGLFDRIKKIIKQSAADSGLPSSDDDLNFRIDLPVNNTSSSSSYKPTNDASKSLVINDYMNAIKSYGQFPSSAFFYYSKPFQIVKNIP